MQGSSYNLQGGTGIPLGATNVQPTSSYQVQPAVNAASYPSSTPLRTSTANTPVLGASTYSAPPPPPPDPYAQWGGTDAYNSLVSGFDAQKQNIYGTSREAAATGGRALGSSIMDYIDSLRSGQRGIDNAGTDNELAKMQGVQGILGMVGRGIRSGGVMLANKNAGDSSATGALARAYGDVGRRQMGQVGSQYEQGNREIGLQQQSLDEQRASGARKIGDSKLNVVDNIVADARNRLAQLDASMAEKSLPQRINIESEKNAIKQEVLTSLAQYDQQLSQGQGSVNPMSQEARRGQASQQYSQGRDLGAGAFEFDDQVPAQWQNSGPFPSELPLFLQPRGRRVA